MLTCWRKMSSSHGLKRCVHKNTDIKLFSNRLLGEKLFNQSCHTNVIYFSVLTCGFILKVSKKYVSKELAKEIHAKAAPFVKWLKEAEEESEGSEEEEEEDDENVEVNLFSHWFSHFI